MDLEEFKNDISELLSSEDESLRLEKLEMLETKFTETLTKINEYEEKLSKFKEDNAKLRNKVWLGTSIQEPTNKNNIEQVPTKKSYEDLVDNILKGGRM